jgi:hypothetical protein
MWHSQSIKVHLGLGKLLVAQPDRADSQPICCKVQETGVSELKEEHN